MLFRHARVLIAGTLFLFLYSCGGGGGGNNPPDPPPPPPPAAVLVSGLVAAPNGQIAREWPLQGIDRWFAVILPHAVASVPGASPVPDGTPVELNRRNADGSEGELLASTTTADGSYTFNFTELGLDFADYLVVTAIGGAGIELRAFVTSENTDIDVESESAVELILEPVLAGSGTLLSDYTQQEIADITATVRLVTLLSGVAASADVSSTVDLIKLEVMAEPGAVTLLDSAALPGQTETGPGDIGNFFPFDDGLAWTFDGSATAEGSTETYTNLLVVDGTRDVNGTETTVFLELSTSDPDVPLETLRVKTDRGISDWTEVPVGGSAIEFVRFPLTPGAELVAAPTDISIDEDLDGDGISETVTAEATSTMVGFEDLALPGGNFANAARIESELSFSGTLTGGGGDFSGSALINEWYARDVGEVRNSLDLSITAAGETLTGTGVEELTGGAFLIAKNIRSSDESFGGVPAAGDGYLVIACDDREFPNGFYGTGVPGSGRRSASKFIGEVHYLPGCEPESMAAGFDGTNYLVVFAKTDNASNTNIVAVRVSGDGLVLDAPEIVVSSGSSNFSPAVDFDGTNYLVVWNKFDLSGGLPGEVPPGHEIYGALIAPDGTSPGEFPVFTSPGEQVFPSVAFDGTNYLVAWRDTRSGSGPSEDTDIYGVRVNAAGAVLDSPEIAIVTAPRTQGGPQVAASGSNWLVVWNDIGSLGTSPPPDGRIFGKRVAPDGSLLDGPASGDGIAIATAPVANYGATVGYVGDSYFVAWAVGSYPSFGTAGIYGVKVSTTGTLVDGSANTLGPSLSGVPPDGTRFGRPRIASKGTEALLVWAQIGGGVDILGKVLDP